MNTQELRIGNWVYKEVGITALEPIKLDLLDIIKHSYTDCFQPIPLTKEWLVKFGFEIDINPIDSEKVYVKYLRDKRTQSIEIGIDMEFYNGIYSQKISHVNQLQNLYFALTGEELTP